jgi:L-fuculose-phosphate aldolase
MRFATERADVLDAVHRIVAAGLVTGASGNVSLRIRTPDRDVFAITASRVPYHRFELDDVLVVDADVEPLVGEGIPSSESMLHLAAYFARPDVGAIIHTHPVHASAFAVAGRPIPPILEEQVVLLGGAVEVADYGESSSEALATNAVRALADRAAVLLRNHGAVSVGRDLDEAVAAAELLERIAQIYVVSAALGGPTELPSDIVDEERRAYRMLHELK